MAPTKPQKAYKRQAKKEKSTSSHAIRTPAPVVFERKPREEKAISTRFRFQSLNKQVDKISVDASTLLRASKKDVDDSEVGTPLSTALASLVEINTTVPFMLLVRKIGPWCKSLPLVLYHKESIIAALVETMQGEGRELCGQAVMDLIPALLQTLPDAPLLVPLLPPLIRSTLLLGLTGNAAPLVEKAFQTIALVFRDLAKEMVNDPAACWGYVREGLGARIPDLEEPEANVAEVVEEAAEKAEVQQETMQVDQPAPEEPSISEPAIEEDDPFAATSAVEEPKAVQPLTFGRAALSKLRTQPHLRHLLASSFAYLVRRCSVDQLSTLIACMNATDFTPQLEESLSWVIMESCQGVDTRLHSRAATIFSCFASQLQDSKVVERAQIAILHHTRVEHADGLVGAVLELAKNGRLRFLSVLLGVRKGNRVAEARMGEVLSLLESLEMQGEEVLGLCVKVFMVAKLQGLLSVGKRVIERMQRSDQGYAMITTLSLALSDLQWPLWSDFLVAPLLQVLQDKLERGRKQQEAIALIARLQANNAWGPQKNKMGRLLELLRQRLVETSDGWIAAVKQKQCAADETKELLDLLSIGALLDAQVLNTQSQALLSAILDSGIDARANFSESPYNISQVLALILPAGLEVAEDQLSAIVDMHSWHRGVLSGLNQCLESLSEKPTVAFESLFNKLQPNLMSEDGALRSETSKLLSAFAPSIEASKMLSACLAAEHVSLTFQQARERSLDIRKIGAMAKNSQDELVVKIAVIHLIATLKVNLKPLWADAVEALATLPGKHHDIIWQIAGQQLLGLSGESELILYLKPTRSWPAPEETEEDTTQSDYSHFTCTNLNKLDQAGRQESDYFAEEQISSNRLNELTFESELLTLLGRLPQVVQKHGRQVIPTFLDHIVSSSTPSTLSSAARQSRLSAWLGMFANLTNPKSIYRCDELYASYLNYLAQGDINVQRLALKCVLTWKEGSLVKLQEQLEGLLDPPKFRDTLLAMPLGQEDTVIPAADRRQTMKVIVHLMFGILTGKSGYSDSARLQATRKNAILVALRSCSPEELSVLVDLMLKPLKKGSAEQETIARPALGFLSLLHDVLQHLGNQLETARLSELIRTTVNLARISTSAANADEPMDEATSKAPSSGMIRNVRKLAVRRFVDFFQLVPNFDASFILPEAFEVIISPRLANLPGDTAQAPSALLNLFILWSTEPASRPLLWEHDAALLPAVYNALVEPSVKAGVVHRVFDLIQNVLAPETPDEEAQKMCIANHVDPLLHNLSTIGSAPNLRDSVFSRRLGLIALLIPSISTYEQASVLERMILPLLKKPPRQVPDRVRVDLLRIFRSISALLYSDPTKAKSAEVEVNTAISTLFSSLTTPASRIELVSTYAALGKLQVVPHSLVELLADLNAFSTKRTEDVDFDRRLKAFNQINESLYLTFTATEWTTIIHNMLFFMQDTEELVIRTNGTQVLRQLISITNTHQLLDVFNSVLLPGICGGLKLPAEICRSEHLGLLGYATNILSGVPMLEEIKCLSVGGDQEASFFANLYHIQHHRRARALKRLADEAEAHHISSSTLNDTFLPLVCQFLPNVKDGQKVDLDLVNETVLCISRTAAGLAWSAYRPWLHHFFRLAKRTTPHQKIFVRCLVGILKVFHFDLSDGGPNAGVLRLVRETLLPNLLTYIEQREESDESMRISVAEGVAHIIKYLPIESRPLQISNLFMALSHILRSKTQEIRDAAKSAICNSCEILGQEALAPAIKEMRSALQRGPQQHVLAYTVHAVLIRYAERETMQEVDLQPAINDVISVVDADLFGHPARDRNSQEFRSRTKFREVRTCKSLDTFQILAKRILPTQISLLLAPIREVLRSADNVKTLKTVDEALTSIATGLQTNDKLSTFDLLSLCQSLIKQNAKFLTTRKSGGSGKQKVHKDHEVVLERKKGKVEGDEASRNAHHFVAFGLDLLNTAFRRNRFDLSDSETVSRLEPLISAVGNTLYSDSDLILARGLKVTAALLRCPLQSLEEKAPLLVKQMLAIVRTAGNTESETAQSALRALSTVIRDCKSVKLSEPQLTELIKIVTPDLEEPDRQSIVFALLRAVMSRKFMAPEIYEIMERVAEILVTNQAAQVREVCRAMFLQFLLDYPQGRGRLKNSLAFLAKNLDYVHESGRLSAMELIHALLTKCAPETAQESSELFFTSLVMIVANDQSTKCCESAAALVKVIIQRAAAEQRRSFFDTLSAWSGQDSQQQLTRTAFQLSTVFVEAVGSAGTKAIASTCWSNVWRVVELASEDLDEGDNGMDADLAFDWRLSYQALQLANALVNVSPGTVDLSKQQWKSLEALLLHPHSWVRLASTRLAGSIYSASGSILAHLPTLDILSLPALIESATKFGMQLESKVLSETLALQLVKNLFFVGKQLATQDTDTLTREATKEDENNSALFDPLEQPLRWIFVKLSRQARLAHVNRPSPYDKDAHIWSLQPSSVFKWFAAMINTLSAAALQPLLFTIITPLYRILDDKQVPDDQMTALQSLAQEVQDLLQEKMGTTEFSKAYSAVQQSVLEHRNKRKQRESMMAVNDPAQTEERRKKNLKSKTESRTRKRKALQGEGSRKKQKE